MPEIPELEVVRDVLADRVVGRAIEHVDVIAPGGGLVVRGGATALAVGTVGELDDALAGLGRRPPRTLVFFSMVDGRKNLHRELMAQLRAARPDVAATAIPTATEVELMGTTRSPVGASAPHSAAARAYERLWGELVAGGYTEPTL